MSTDRGHAQGEHEGEPRDAGAPGDRPWWASDDPAGHGTGDASAHGEHVRPAWMDAVEAIDGVVRAATRGAKDAAGRVTDARDGLQGHVDGMPNGERPGGGSDGGDGGDGGDGSGGGQGDGMDGHRHGAIDAYCHICPVCSLLRAIEDVRPDVLLHLTEAARQLTLAAKAIVDAQADRIGPEEGFESIPVDD